MPGPQTQHKGTVYGDDEKRPQTITYLLTYLLYEKVTRVLPLPACGRDGGKAKVSRAVAVHRRCT